MSITGYKLWLLAVGIPLLATSFAWGQVQTDFAPGLGDAQIFEPLDYAPFGRLPRRNEGWWGSIEYLHWSVSTPERAVIGNPNLPATFLFGPGAKVPNTGVAPIAANTPWVAGTFPSAPPGGPSDAHTLSSALAAREAAGGIVDGVPQFNSLDTTFLETQFGSGLRAEFGYVDDGFGWFVSAFSLPGGEDLLNTTNMSVNFGVAPIAFIFDPTRVTPQGQRFHLDLDGDNVFGAFGRDRGTPQGNIFVQPLNGIPDGENLGDPQVPIDYDDAVPLPTVFDQVRIRQRTEVWGVEVNGLFRNRYEYLGAMWEWFAGPRYLQIQDDFYVSTFRINPRVDLPVANRPAISTSIFNDTDWNTEAMNNLIGAQLGGRVVRTNGRLSLVGEGRFMPSANFQSIRQWGTFRINTIGFDVTNLPAEFVYNHTAHDTEFSMLGELRLGGAYQLFRNVSFEAGWTGMFVSGIARSSNMIEYQLPDFGINMDENRQNVFIHGINFGININR